MVNAQTPTQKSFFTGAEYIRVAQHGRRQYKRLKTGPREEAQSTLGFAAAPAPADYDGHTQMEADRAEHGMDWNPGVEPCKR